MSKRTVRLTESDLKNIIKESVKNVLNEDYDYKSDFEDGGNLYDRTTYGMNDDEIDNWQKREHLNGKRDKNDNYEFYRYQKLDNYHSREYFLENMIEKIKKTYPKYNNFFINDEYYDMIEKTKNSLKEMSERIHQIFSIFEMCYDKTGDERYLLAAACLRDNYNDMFNKHQKFDNSSYYFKIETRFKSDYNYNPLSKDKVYTKNSDYDGTSYYNRLATTKDRKKGLQGSFE